MRIISLALAGLLLAGTALAQQTQPQPTKPAAPPAADSLEAQIAAALKNNPDIKVAEAKVREAEAGLNKARVMVMQQVVAAHAAVHAAKADVAITESEVARFRDLKGVVSTVDLHKAEHDLARAKAILARTETDLQLVLGKALPGTVKLWDELPGRPTADVLTFDPDGRRLYSALSDGTVRVWDAGTGKALSRVPEVKPGSMTEKIRSALDKPVKIDKPYSGSVKDILEWLQDFSRQRNAAEIPFRMLPRQKMDDTAIELMTGELPLSAWLLAIEDSAPDLRIVVREYGLLVTTKDRMPEDAVRLREFLRSTAAKPKEESKKQ
ncbi:MAG: hypothetical protein ACJ8F7_05840 [Gemmataceae bacterium]